jgi:hypothetical protein
MGLFGIPLDTDTLLIAPIILGIAVDDTIHFMTHYRIELSKTGSIGMALDSAIKEVGQAVMFTTMVIGLGFAVLSFSDYLGMAKVGFFGSMAIFVALLCDLFLIPAMIIIFKPKFGVIIKQGLNYLTALFLGIGTLYSGAQEISGLEIMQLVEDAQRRTNDSSFNRMQLSSCKFGVTDGRITCAERPRVKSLESVSKNYGAELKDTKSVTITLEPAAERGIGMLSYAYDEAGRDNETWLYLSTLGRVKRIAAGDTDEETEPASLFGSEFTTEDTDTGKLEEYSFNILEETTTSGREVWKLEMIPNEERARKTRYSRQVHYVDKERLVTLRSEMYDRYDKEIKRLMASRVELVNDVWMSRSLTMMNLVTNRLSNMAFVEIYTDLTIDDEFLTQRTLTDAAYRETELESLRAQLNQ